jgi:hypothetical protein
MYAENQSDIVER